MGLEKEIRELFERVVELDLARISRSAVPTYHWSRSLPPSMFSFYKQEQTVDDDSIRVTVQPEDYQLVKIELDPLELESVRLEKMKQIQKRRHARNMPADTDFDNYVNAGKHGDAYHEYIDQTGALDPTPIVPRTLDLNAKTKKLEKMPLVVSVRGVDFVRADLVDDDANDSRYKQVAAGFQVIPEANVDLWPEEVVLRHPVDSKQDVTYYRFDAVVREGGKKVDRRLPRGR